MFVRSALRLRMADLPRATRTVPVVRSSQFFVATPPTIAAEIEINMERTALRVRSFCPGVIHTRTNVARKKIKTKGSKAICRKCIHFSFKASMGSSSSQLFRCRLPERTGLLTLSLWWMRQWGLGMPNCLFSRCETDAPTCAKCQGEMRIISFIDQPDVIRKILQPLGLWEEAHASHSIAVETRNPACSKPRLRPPAPAKRSRTLGPVRLIGVFSWKYEQQGQLGTCSRRTRVIWSI